MNFAEKHSLLNKKIPAIKVTLEDGEKVALKELIPASEMAVLYFYPRDNTPGCTQEAKDFQSSLRKFKNKGVTIVGVSADSVKSHQKFIDKYKLKFPLIADEDRKLCEKLGVWQKKKFMGKEFMGIVRSTFLIKDHKIIRVWQPVKVKEHVDEVLESVKELG